MNRCTSDDIDWADTSQFDGVNEGSNSADLDWDDMSMADSHQLPDRMTKYEHLISNDMIDDAYYRIDSKSHLRKPACSCSSGNCVDLFTKPEIRAIRSFLWRDHDEAAVMLILSQLIRSGKDQIKQYDAHRSSKKYFFSCLDSGDQKVVCRVAYQKIYGISNNKYRHAERFAKSGKLLYKYIYNVG